LELNFTLEAKNFFGDAGNTNISTFIPVEIIICGDETIVETVPGLNISRYAMNQGEVEVFTDVELLELFTVGVRTEFCPISTIEYLHTGNSTAILETDETGVLLGLADKETQFDPFTFDTTFVSRTGEIERSYNITLKATTYGSITVNKQIQIFVGCFEEASLETEILAEEELPVPWLAVETNLKITIPYKPAGTFNPDDPLSYIQSVPLDTLVTYTSDIETCGASHIQLCSVEDCSTLSVLTTHYAAL